jgi:hypothetical protein
MKQTPMPPRTRPLEARTELRRVPFQQKPGPWPRTGTGAGSQVKNAATGKDTGFSRAVKLAVRTRAGGGDPDLAACEACGIWLGRKRGQVQHRVGRGAGGCTDEVINGCANAALMCGTPLTGCHGKATAFDPDLAMDAGGFWIKHGTTPEFDPRNIPILLHSAGGSGIRVFLAADGLGPDGTGYLLAPPGEVAA